MRKIFTITSLLICLVGFGQGQSKKILFLGNSYTYVNNLPQMVADVATSVGDTAIFDSSAPGGYTLQQHCLNATSLSKIAIGNWDYVVLQEQSQLPSFPDSQVETDVFPYAHILDSAINANSPCAETVFYMTWGRKNGDASNCASWPPVCTYSGMDSLLSLRYKIMADSNNAILSPAGAVWHYIRQNFPLIELYSADESHPSVAGTYAIACCFYATLFRKDPSVITFNPALPTADAAIIRNAAKLIVYDNLLNWHIGEYDPSANFNYISSGSNQITFTNTSINASAYTWNFGDGNTSSTTNPIHQFPAAGSYTITLTANKCGKQNTTTQTIIVTLTDVLSQKYQNNYWTISPNPTTTYISVSSNKNEKLSFKIYNVTGSIIKGGFFNSEKEINVDKLPEGIYFLQLFNNDISIGQQKFIKTNN